MMMGRPIKYTPKEIETTVLRGRYMISLAEQELADVDVEVGHTPVKGLKRFIRKEPLGIVLAISGMSSFVKSNSSLELPIVDSRKWHR
jgi:acyl-CoA reductase-like NAD-dependent aldehyde dehydrogenase